MSDKKENVKNTCSNCGNKECNFKLSPESSLRYSYSCDKWIVQGEQEKTNE